MDEYIGDVYVDFAGEGAVDVVSSVDGSAGGLDSDSGPWVVFWVLARSVCLESGGGKNGIGAKFMAVARAKSLMHIDREGVLGDG